MALKISVEKILPVGGSTGVSVTPLADNKITKVNIEQILPFGQVEAQTNDKVILITETPAIYDAFVQANKDEVTKLTQEVREAHTHIHADRDQVRADRTQVDTWQKQVTADKNTVRADKNTVDSDKKQVQEWRSHVSQWTVENRNINEDVRTRQSDVATKHNNVVSKHTDVVNKHSDVVTKHSDISTKYPDIVTKHGQVSTWHGQVDTWQKQVTADKNTVASDKTTVNNYKNESKDYAAQALSSKNSALSSATTSTNEASKSKTEADRAKTEADRAKSIADGININGGQVNGNLVVTGTIKEGGKLLSDKYAQITYVDKQIADLKGGADGAYDTLKELQDAIQNNEGGIGTITTALGTKLDKAGGTVTGELKVTTTAALNGLSLVNSSGGKLMNLSAGHLNHAMFYINKDDELTKNGLLFRSLLANGTGSTDLFKIGIDGEVYAKGNSRVYHAGNKPVWADIGGNSVINITGSYNKLQRGYLCAQGEGTGFLPDQSGTTGRSRVGTASWWFKESYVAKTFTQELNVGDATTNITIKKVGNTLQFLV